MATWAHGLRIQVQSGGLLVPTVLQSGAFLFPTRLSSFCNQSPSPLRSI